MKKITLPVSCFQVILPVIFFQFIFIFNVNAQLTTTRKGNYGNMTYLVNKILLGSGITATNVTYQGIDTSFGFFNGTKSNIGMDSGIIITNGTLTLADGPNAKTYGDKSDGAATTYNFGAPTDGWPNSNNYNDSDLANLIGTTYKNTYSCAVLQFDFTATSDSIEFQYVFASNEEPYYVGSSYLDDFGFFLRGPGITGPFENNAENLALIPGTTTAVYINSVNCTTNSSYYVCNYPSSTGCSTCPGSLASTTIGYNGFTTVLTAKAKVQCGKKYHIKLGVANIANGRFDSGVLLKAGSFSPISKPMTVSPLSSTICSGNSVTLTAAGASGYTWSPASSLSATTGSSVNATPTVTTTYTVIGNIIGGCDDTAKITINVNSTPAVTASANQNAICNGSSTTLTAAGAATYTWQPGSLSGSTVSVSPTTPTTYTVTGITAAGCTDTGKVTVTINPTPTLTITGGTTICPSGSTILTVSGANTYSWSPATGLSSATDSVVTANPAGTQTYTVTGTTPEGCTGTANVTITVVPTLTVTITASSSSICSGGGSATLTAGGASTYTWAPATGLSSTTGTTVTATPTATTTYTLIGTSGSGCSDSAKQTITVNPTPTLTVTAASGIICPGGSGTTVTVSGATNYTWSPATGLSSATDSVVNANPGSTQTYTVTGTTGAGCSATAPVTITVDNPTVSASAAPPAICNGSSTSLNATGGVSYAWSPATGLSCTSCSNPTASGLATGTTTYNVTDTDANGCTATGSVSITVNPLPVVTASAGDTELCQGGGTILNAGGAGTYAWTPSGSVSCATCSVTDANPSGTTTYTVTGTDGNGCSNTASVTVTVNPTPTLSISLSGGDTLCSGQSVTMTASGATNYTWSPATGLSCSTCPNPSATPPSSPIVYTVVGTNGTCTDSASQALYLYPPLNVIVTGDSVCAGNSDTVTAMVNGGKPGYNYIWNNGLGTGPGPYIVKPVSPTNYICTVTDGCGDTLSGGVVVYTITPPNAIFTAVPDTIMGGQYVSFINSSTNAVSYVWSFGESNSGSTTVNPYFQYSVPGTYVVYLTASNGRCTSSAYDTIYVLGGITVPNVFTPNGDGQNDVFHITAGGLKTYYLEIFNRWGQKVFEANSPNIDWTGRSLSGVEESDGVYYYIIKATDYNEKVYNLKGYLQLIRGK